MPPTLRSGRVVGKRASARDPYRADGLDTVDKIKKTRVREALITLNKSVMTPFTNVLKLHPAGDLAIVLHRTLRTYSDQRDRYTKVASDDVLRADLAAKAQVGKLRAAGGYKLPCPKGAMIITRPLATPVVRLLGLSTGRIGEPKVLSSRGPRTPAARLLRAIETGRLIWHLCGKFVIKLDDQIAVKFSGGMETDDAVAMEHIHSHAPNIPIPEPYGVASIDGYNYVFMSFIEGVSLDKLWPSLTVPLKQSIQSQLNTIMHQLRAIPIPPGAALGSGEPRRCKDQRRYPRNCPDEICTEVAFNDFLVESIDRPICDAWLTMLRSQLRDDHEMVMTHGDLRPANIMVEQTTSESIQIKAIVDWASGGVYPEYWEYVRACNGLRPWSKTDWFYYLPTIAIGRYFKEYNLDCMVDQIHT